MLNLESLIKEFLYYLEFGESRSINSIKCLASDLKQFKIFVLERDEIEKIDDITQFTIRSFLTSLGKKGVNKRSLNRKLSTVKSFFRYLIENEKTEKNPALLVETPSFEIDSPDIITYAEIEKLRAMISLKNISGIRDRLIIELLYSSGVTCQELLFLGEKVFNLENRELQILRDKSYRIVFFSERAKEFFKNYIELKKEKYKEKYNSNILFVNNSGTRLSDRSLRRLLDRYAKRAGIEREIGPYMFRHTFAAHMLLNNMELEMLKNLMGHSSIEITKKYKAIVKNPKIFHNVIMKRKEDYE
ncbi:MAG: tyrosine-type recombinase/integrase [Fusobacteriaceae bacterium]